MNPTAIACQSGPPLSAEFPAPVSRTRQRIQRTGKVSVPRMTATISGSGRAARTWVRTSAGLTPRSAHHRSAPETTTPAAAGNHRRSAAGPTACSGFGKREGNEVEQLLQQWLKRGEAGVARELGGDLLPDHVGPLQRGMSPIEERGDGHRWGVRIRAGSNVLPSGLIDQPAKSGCGGGPLALQTIERAEARLEPAHRRRLLRQRCRIRCEAL